MYYKYIEGPISNEGSHWGEFGDFVGGTLNPILSFITISLLIISTTLQKRELAEARNGISASNEALNKQCEILTAQANEQTFFKLLEDFKSDRVVQQCLEEATTLHLSMYNYWVRAHKNGEKIRLKDAFLTDMPAGAFSQVFMIKLDLIIQVIQKLKSKAIYTKLLQAHIGPELAATACQYSLMLSEGAYARIKANKLMLRGIMIDLIYIEDIIKDLRPGNEAEYSERKNEIHETLTDRLNKLIGVEEVSKSLDDEGHQLPW